MLSLSRCKIQEWPPLVWPSVFAHAREEKATCRLNSKTERVDALLKKSAEHLKKKKKKLLQIRCAI